MKKFKLSMLLILMSMLVFSACGGGGGGNDDPDNPDSILEINGDTYTYTLPGGTIFNAILTPDIAVSKSFPTGPEDNGSANVPARFIMLETEVTHQLWKEVYDWATSTERGTKKYAFANAGTMGDGSGDTNQHPVTRVSWRDSIVWCNALTEYYNANNGSETDLVCVYTYSGSIIRDSRNSNATACDGAVAGSVKGFRLPRSMEWEFVARYRGTNNTNVVSGFSNPYYTKGDSASGAASDYNNASMTSAVAVYGRSGTAVVKSKNESSANTLGFYDMSGNVWEWCFDKDGASTSRVARGGCFGDEARYVQVGGYSAAESSYQSDRRGLRFCMTK